MAEEEVTAVEEVNSTHHAKGTQTFTEAIEEPSEEGGASTPNMVGKRGPQLAIIAAKSATTRRSDRKREVSQLQQVDNSQTTHLTPTTTIVVKCLQITPQILTTATVVECS